MNHPCRACEQQFADESQRKRHRFQAHLDHNIAGYCLLCLDTSLNKFDFYDHFVEKHPHQFGQLVQKIEAGTGQPLAFEEQQIWIVEDAFKPMQTEDEVMKLMLEKNEGKINEMKVKREEVNGNGAGNEHEEGARPATANIPNDPFSLAGLSPLRREPPGAPNPPILASTRLQDLRVANMPAPGLIEPTLSHHPPPRQQPSEGAATSSTSALPSVKIEPRETPQIQRPPPESNSAAVISPIRRQPSEATSSTRMAIPILPIVKIEPRETLQLQVPADETFPLSSISPLRQRPSEAGPSRRGESPIPLSVKREIILEETAAQNRLPIPLSAPPSRQLPSTSTARVTGPSHPIVKTETVEPAPIPPAEDRHRKRTLDPSNTPSTSAIKQAKTIRQEAIAGNNDDSQQPTCSNNSAAIPAKPKATKNKGTKTPKKPGRNTPPGNGTMQDDISFGEKVNVVTAILDELRSNGVQGDQALMAAQQSGFIPANDVSWDSAMSVATWDPLLLAHISSFLLIHERFHVRPYALTRIRQAYETGGPTRDRCFNLIEAMGRRLSEEPNLKQGLEKMIRDALGTLPSHPAGPPDTQNDAEFAASVAAAAVFDEDGELAASFAFASAYDNDSENENGNDEDDAVEPPANQREEEDDDDDANDPNYVGRA